LFGSLDTSATAKRRPCSRKLAWTNVHTAELRLTLVLFDEIEKPMKRYGNCFWAFWTKAP